MLKGKALGIVAAEVEKDRADAELAKETARVKRVVDDILGGIKAFNQRIDRASKLVAELNTARDNLQNQLDAIKAGDAAAVKMPETTCFSADWSQIEERMVRHMYHGARTDRFHGFNRW